MPLSRAPIGRRCPLSPPCQTRPSPGSEARANDKQADAIVRGVAEEIERIRLKGGRASRQASCYLDRETQVNKAGTEPNSAPTVASSTTTIHGGAFQTVSSRNPASVSAKSSGVSTALVQTGL
jgi:hypothetical protein